MNVEHVLILIFAVELVHLVLCWIKLSRCLPWKCPDEKPCEEYNWWDFS